MNTTGMTLGEHLPFPTQPLRVADRFLEEYVIPPDRKGEVLRKLYPSFPVPALGAMMLDLHEERFFRVGEFRVLRGGGTDWLVSPYFPSSGATVEDWDEVVEVQGN